MIIGLFYCFNWLQGYLSDEYITSSRPYFKWRHLWNYMRTKENVFTLEYQGKYKGPMHRWLSNSRKCFFPKHTRNLKITQR